MARKIKSQPQRNVIPTLIGAGITEQWYFTHLKNLLGCRIRVRPRFFGQEDIYQISKKVESVIVDGGFAIVVFDADVANWDEKERVKLASMRKKYEHNPNVIICDSLPSIEYWFLLHFSDVHRLFQTSSSVKRELIKYLPGFDKTDNYLSSPTWVKELCKDNKLQIAIQNASKCEDGQSIQIFQNHWIKSCRNIRVTQL